MKINPLNAYNKINKTNKASRVNKVTKVTTEINDKVEISSEAKAIDKTIQLAKKSNNDRDLKVSAIKEQIDNGTYEVSSYDVASKIIDSINEKE